MAGACRKIHLLWKKGGSSNNNQRPVHPILTLTTFGLKSPYQDIWRRDISFLRPCSFKINVQLCSYKYIVQYIVRVIFYTKLCSEMDAVLEALSESGKKGEKFSQGFPKVNATLQNTIKTAIHSVYGDDLDAVSIIKQLFQSLLLYQIAYNCIDVSLIYNIFTICTCPEWICFQK